jgi:hypothetical protein
MVDARFLLPSGYLIRQRMASLDDFICDPYMLAEADEAHWASGPVPLTMTGGPKVLADEKARLVAEKARTKDAMKDAKLVAAMHHIKMLKAFIKAAGLKVPTL